MNRTERFYLIDKLLHERRVVSISEFLEVLGVSRATFKRDLQYLRERLHAPIAWDGSAGGYRLAGDDLPEARSGPRYALPGLWFNASEVHALLAMRQLLETMQPGLLGPHVEPLLARIRGLLERSDHSAEEVARRIRVLPAAARSLPLETFGTLCTALLSRRRLRIRHYSRERDEETERVVSPQRLVHYRDNWYLDAYCHLRRALRSFAVDCIREAELRSAPAREVDEAPLDRHLGSGYGIFSGRRTRTATLVFSASRARWVAVERWHPHQRGRFLDDGRFELEVPYSDPRELVMDVLKHGAEVEVAGPAELRRTVSQALESAAALYREEPVDD